MGKQEKNAKQRKVKDLEPDTTTGTNVKGGQAAIPSRASIYRTLNKTFRPKSSSTLSGRRYESAGRTAGAYS